MVKVNIVQRLSKDLPFRFIEQLEINLTQSEGGSKPFTKGYISQYEHLFTKSFVAQLFHKIRIFTEKQLT